jgi:hypothetical protein
MVLVLTTPRRPQFLAATLRGLDAAGAQQLQRLLCVDGPLQEILKLRVVPAGWEIESIGTGDQGTQVACRAACAAYARRGGADDLMYFEDDVLPCRNAVAGLAKIPVPDDCGFLAAFANIIGQRRFHPSKQATPGEPAIIRQAADDPDLHGTGHWGNQALKIPRRTVEHLVRQLPTYYAVSRRATGRMLFGSDKWIGQHAASAGAPWHVYGLISPSLFQHVGARSAIGAHWKLDGRTSPSWRADFDALTLPGLLRSN